MQIILSHMYIYVHDTIKTHSKHRRILIPYLYTIFKHKDNVSRVYKMCVNGKMSFMTLFCAICVMQRICVYSEVHTDKDWCKSSHNSINTNIKEASSVIGSKQLMSSGRLNNCHPDINPTIHRLSVSFRSTFIIFTASIIITTKILFDYVYTMSDWSKLTKLSTQQLNEIERYALYILDYKLVLNNDELETTLKKFEKKSECKIVVVKKTGLKSTIEWMMRFFGCDRS